jgi:hypothetical protein
MDIKQMKMIVVETNLKKIMANIFELQMIYLFPTKNKENNTKRYLKE